MAALSGETHGRRLFAPLLILLILILLGYWLRVHNLDAFSFWTDEGLTPERSGYSIARILRNDILIQGVVTKDTHPALYYLIIHASRPLFGLSDFAFRYPSILFGVLFIPLIYQLGRRLSDVTPGLIVALLAAVNPLQVYYSQEARMYTLLVLLVTAMSYVLWRVASDELRVTSDELRVASEERTVANRDSSRIARYFLLYALPAALAVYTHYTAVFVVAVQGAFWVWILWRNGLKRVILAAAALAVLAAIPLIPYTVPRLLAGAEANYYYVSPLTMLLDVVRFFNLGLTVDFGQPLIIALNILAFALLLLGVWAAARPSPDGSGWPIRHRAARPLFLLAWLLAPVLGLMLGSILFKPMYQGVRHIMAGSPAFLLLLAFGLWAIWNRLPERGKPVDDGELTGWTAWRASRPGMNPLALIPLGLLLLGSLFALVNLYTDPSYVKDDFRAIVRFIETHAGNRDAIVYNNAVLLPLHEHYRLRPDLAVTAVPAYPTFATGQEPELAALARDYERVWFITDPPADGRDADGLIWGWLHDNQTEVINRLFPARTTEARVVGYLSSDPSSGGDRQANLVSTNWTSMPNLVSAAFDYPLALPSLWVDLVWRGARPVVNASLLFTLIGPDGVEYYREARPILPDRDTRWDDAADNRLSYNLPLPPGLPPGSYTLTVTPESHDTVALGEVEIAPTGDWPVPPEALFDEVPGRSAIVWPNGLALVTAIPWDDDVLPGNNLPMTLYWRTGPDGIDLSGLRYRLEVIDGRGQVLRVQEGTPGAPWLGRVDGGALLREITALYIRPDAATGDYRLRWSLLDGDAPAGEPQTHGRIAVVPWPLETSAPPAPYTSGADFGDTIRLHSYYRGVPANGLLHLTFYWQTLAPPADYVVFIHLVDEAGQIVSQVDSIPAGGARPTSGWRAREVVTDSHNLPIPDDLPPGRYHVNVGLYNPDDDTRLPVTLDGALQPDNQLRLTTLELPWGTP